MATTISNTMAPLKLLAVAAALTIAIGLCSCDPNANAYRAYASSNARRNAT